jgi:hypothetical protein
MAAYISLLRGHCNGSDLACVNFVSQACHEEALGCHEQALGCHEVALG